jgi:sterol desaturase/sphingolipid hydroxylase (fatty acid hydroxylase superfamily)
MKPGDELQFVDLQSLQMIFVFGGLAAFLLLETVIPEVRAGIRQRLRSGSRNMALFVITTVVTSLVIGAFYFYGAAVLAVNRVGLLYASDLPGWAVIATGVIALDFSDYLYHRISHERKWLWVMHAVHHSEVHLDVTTHFRQHPLHMLVSVVWRLVVIAAIGIPFWLVLVRDALLGVLVQWQHSNVRVPEWLDRWLRPVIVTPGMHRIHHSPLSEETDSNFGGFLSLWDRLLGTYRAEKLPSPDRYGLRQLAAPAFQSVGGLLLTPIRAWRLAGRL